MKMRKILLILGIFGLVNVQAQPGKREIVWPKGKMPHAQEHQIAAMTDESEVAGFNPDKHRTAYLEWFEAPKNIWTKEPSAGLFDGQTDEKDLGVTYAQIAQVIQSGSCGDEIANNKIKSMHEKTKHKRSLPKFFKGE